MDKWWMDGWLAGWLADWMSGWVGTWVEHERAWVDGHITKYTMRVGETLISLILVSLLPQGSS